MSSTFQKPFRWAELRGSIQIERLLNNSGQHPCCMSTVICMAVSLHFEASHISSSSTTSSKTTKKIVFVPENILITNRATWWIHSKDEKIFFSSEKTLLIQTLVLDLLLRLYAVSAFIVVFTYISAARQWRHLWFYYVCCNVWILVTIHFTCLGDDCNVFFLWNSSRVQWTKKSSPSISMRVSR